MLFSRDSLFRQRVTSKVWERVSDIFWYSLLNRKGLEGDEFPGISPGGGRLCGSSLYAFFGIFNPPRLRISTTVHTPVRSECSHTHRLRVTPRLLAKQMAVFYVTVGDLWGKFPLSPGGDCAYMSVINTWFFTTTEIYCEESITTYVIAVYYSPNLYHRLIPP